MHISRVLAALFAATTLFSAQAGISAATGSTVGGSTFNRPLEDGSDLSAIGTATRYSTYDFTVSVTGDYTFLTTGGFDTFNFLYSPALDASAPLTNYLGGNDDLLGTSTSGFAASLTAGTAYSLVTTGYENADFGAFSSTIGGPGSVVSSTASAGPVAGISTLAGDTTGAPTFNRALEDLSDLSAIGTAVHYDARTIRVDASGTYTFLTTAEFDSFLFLYDASFDPTAALLGGNVGSDDLLGLTTSGFAFDLVAGVDYTLVTTGYENSDFGAFSTTIGGPGDLVTAAVPEPETYALLLAGLGAMGLMIRRRRSA